MNELFDMRHSRVDKYEYQINGTFTDPRGPVEIIFVDKQFSKATVPFQGVWPRFAWRVLAGIEEEITRLEQELQNEKQ